MSGQKIQDRLKQVNSNVVVSIDKQTKSEIMEILDCLADCVLGVKLHSDIVIDEPNIGKQIKQKYPNLLIIEDRKFCDIGNTVMFQSKNITKYADLITVHSLPGEGIIQGLRNNCVENDCRILLLAQMSSKDNLIDKEYTRKTIELAKKHKDIVVGFIAQEKLADGFWHFTPGVRLNEKGDNLGQQYNTPTHLINDKNVDILIVGRGICQGEISEIKTRAEKYNTYGLWKLQKDIASHEIIKTGEFVLKSGKKSNVYADFRRLLNFPNLLANVVHQTTKLIKRLNLKNDNTIVVGVPMGAIPLSVLLSQELCVPMAMLRDKPKDHGTKKLIEGPRIDEMKESNIILVEDVVTSGTSVVQAISLLQSQGINANQITVIVLLDRQKGACERIQSEKGCKVYSLFKLSNFVKTKGT